MVHAPGMPLRDGRRLYTVTCEPEFGPNDHREDAPHFTCSKISFLVTISVASANCSGVSGNSSFLRASSRR